MTLFNRLPRISSLLLFTGGLCVVQIVTAADSNPFGDIKLIRIIPRSESEIAQAHERNRSQSCETVPPGEPLEIKGFKPVLTERDRAEWGRGYRLLPSSRRNMFTVGLDMLSADRDRLPTVSGSQIERYIRGHYVTIQARVQKDPLTSKLFLHHRPLAATVSVGKGNLTEEFTDAVLTAVREFHSLGIFLPGAVARSPENLRTLVMIYRNKMAIPTGVGGKPQFRYVYEYAFVRARDVVEENQPDVANQRELVQYVFATSDQRRRLHLLKPWSTPTQPSDCGVRATVFFTEYTTLGLIPSKSATRSVVYSSHSVFDWPDLERYSAEQDWKGDALDNLPQILDAILDAKIKARDR